MPHTWKCSIIFIYHSKCYYNHYYPKLFLRGHLRKENKRQLTYEDSSQEYVAYLALGIVEKS